MEQTPVSHTAAAPNDGSDRTAESDEVIRLRQALEESEATRRDLDEFISLLAHDLRTPLTSIRGYAQLLLRHRQGQPELLPTVKNGLQTIVQEADRLSAQTELLLDVSRVRLDRVALATREIDLIQMVQVVLTGFERGVAPFEADPQAGSIRVMGDADRLRKAVRTLVEYSCHHGGDAGDVRVSLCRNGTRCDVFVDAPGDALDAEQRDAIFTRLYDPTRPDAVDRLKPSAMYVARGLAHAHGGDISATSPVPGSLTGLRLTLSVPLAAQAV